MHHTIFDTPVVNTVMRWFSVSMLRLLGWKVDGTAPAEPKYVMIAAPHTSNWDFPVTLMVAFAMRLKLYWMGKDSLFPPLLGALMRWLGGIAVDRSKSGNMVQGTVDAFGNTPQLAVLVPPEGTRGKVTHWRTGFYYIALGAKVPIALGYLDFKRKVGGIGRMFYPTGDLEADMAEIQKFYAGITGKNPQHFSADHIQAKGD
ncbi:MAG: lysophospholipid acyltransferase family protein [Pseudomonadota bacterium]